MPPEIVRLCAHEKLILDVIRKQAGTFDKAVLECVMNGIEAQLATTAKPKIWIEYSDEGNGVLVVRDPGRGFRSRKEINEWFAQFGTPHEASEGKKWAEFRMGRGQAFSFGRNVWRTGTFRMEYDLETDPAERSYKCSHALDFALESDLENYPGCEVTIHFYKRQVGKGYFYSSVDAFKSAIKKQVEFMEGEIYFNGEQINTPASECTWDIVTEDAYFMFGKGHDLTLYNMGAYVKPYDAASAGVTGVVVSKEKMDVNFARNSILSTCEIFQRIWLVIRDNKVKRIRAESRWLNDNQKINALLELRDGEIKYSDIKTLGLFELAGGKFLSLDAVRKMRSPWTFAMRGDDVADRLDYLNEAICFADDVLAALDYTGKPVDFFNWLLRESFRDCDGGPKSSDWNKIRAFYRDFSTLADGYDSVHKILSTDDQSKAERRFLRAMESYQCWRGRTLCIGTCDTANGWTDGSSYIVFNRAFLKDNNPGYDGGVAACVTLAIHELAHDSDDTGTHVHSAEFYRAYHDLTRGSALHIIASLARKLDRVKWETKAEEEAEKAAKALARRDKALGLKKVVVIDPMVVQPKINGANVVIVAGKVAASPKVRIVKKSKRRRLRRF